MTLFMLTWSCYLTGQIFRPDDKSTSIRWIANFKSESSQLKATSILPLELNYYSEFYTYNLHALYNLGGRLQRMVLTFEEYVPAIKGTNITEPDRNLLSKVEIRSLSFKELKDEEKDKSSAFVSLKSMGKQPDEPRLNTIDSGLGSMPDSLSGTRKLSADDRTPPVNNSKFVYSTALLERIFTGVICKQIRVDSGLYKTMAFQALCQQLLSVRSSNWLLWQAIRSY